MATKPIPLDIPPGIITPGTNYQGKGRWIDSDIIRWNETGRLGPIKGWVKNDVFDDLYDIVYLDVSGAGSVSAPDHADFDPAGDLELTAVIQADDYTPSTEQVLIDKLGAAGGGGYRLSLLTNGQLRLYWDDGSSRLSVDSGTAVTAPTNAWEALAVYVELDVDNGSSQHEVKFYTGPVPAGRTVSIASAPGLIGEAEARQYYTLLGSVTNAGTTSVAANSTNVTIGDVTTVTGDGFEGRFYYAIVINETVPFIDQDDGDTSFAFSGHTWTLAGDASMTFSKDGTHFNYISNIIHWVADGLSDEWLIGTAGRLWHYDGTLTEITPSPFTAGEDISVVSNWTVTWGMALFGEDVVVVPASDTDLYYYDASAGTLSNLTSGSGAPSNLTSAVVTPERFIVTLGNYNDPRKVSWADQESTSTWTAASTNQAGDKILDGRGNLLRGLALEEETLIFGETDLHVMQYIGGTFVYGFRQIGTDCGIVGPNAVASVQDNVAYWMGRDAFFVYNGAVREIACPVREYVFDDINIDERRKVYAQHIPQTNEIFWFFCSEDSAKVDKYVKYNYQLEVWDVGALSRTAGFPLELGFGESLKPHMSDIFGNIYTHEEGTEWDDEDGTTYTAFVESGPIELGSGDRFMSIQTVIPDIEGTNILPQITFYGANYPNADETTFGPYSLSSLGTNTGIRATARQFRMKVEDTQDRDWSLGIIRLKVAPRGRR